MMTSCLRPHRLAPLVWALISVLRCCSRSWRSWPVSATRLMGASWRSWPRWIATSCGVPRARGRWRRWWPGRSARHRETPPRSPPWRAGWRRSRAARRVCGRAGCRWIRSGSSRGGRARDLMSIMRRWRAAQRWASCAPRSGWNRDTRTRWWARTAGLDHQDLRRGGQLLADQTWSPGCGEVRRGAAVSS